MLEKLLVANRGEIAVRIIRACRELGIKSVAVYSDADITALHVHMADEAYSIGGHTPQESYLRIESMIDTAKKAGCDSIHPGYGFLAENADFALASEKERLAFVGPRSSTLKMTGDKMECRRVMSRSSVPVTPGGDKIVEDVNEALNIAEAVGFPVLLKSAFGGGGRGIRVAGDIEELRQFFDIAQRESKIAFGKTGIYVEQFISDARHIEIQVVFDSKGRGVHLGERECSIQRRYQKLIEMSPSPIVTKDERQMLGELAIKAGKAVAYTNAGTVEFIRTSDGQYYFIEFNTRLQVEHPVTEMVTGVDIVKMQLAMAGGELLESSQSKFKQNGWAIECRINSEDPSDNFLPSAGVISYYSAPSGPWTRFDTAIYQGYEVPPYYDSLIGKLIVWGPTFEEARIRMLRALGELTIEGIATNISMHQVILNNQSFIRGDFSTRFLEREDLTPKILSMADEERAKLEDEAVSIGAVLTEVRRVKTSIHTVPSNQPSSSWRGVLELKDGRHADGF